jgi:hypothetical protein
MRLGRIVPNAFNLIDSNIGEPDLSEKAGIGLFTSRSGTN